MIDRFVFFLPFVQGNLPLIEDLACAFVGRQASQNVLYTELRYSPHLLTNAATYDVDPNTCATCTTEAPEVLAAVTRGLRRGCAQHPGTEITQILCLIDGKPEWADSLVRLAEAGRAQPVSDCPVVAIDLAAGESHFAPDAADGVALTDNSTVHRQAFCRACQLGLGVTNHAGESGPAKNVAAAVSSEYGQASRVGHGYAAVYAAFEAAAAPEASATAPTPAAVAAAFRANGVTTPLTFECCPTSSRCTRAWPGSNWAEHPLARMYRLREQAAASGDDASMAALPKVTLSSDDPAVFGKSLTDECELVVGEMGLGEAALRTLAADAVDACFLDTDGKARLRTRLEAAWSEFDAAWPRPAD